MRFNRPVDPRTPDVLIDFDWPFREKFNSFLEIDIQFCNKASRQIDRTHISRAPWEREKGLQKYEMTKQELQKGQIL